MIAIASSALREGRALATLCEQRGWNTIECHSVRAVNRAISRMPIRVMIVRYQLQDGYSDDVIVALADLKGMAPAKVIVLLPAGTSSTIEVRQLNLGADCVQRDPVRSDVLLAYVEKYLRRTAQPRVASSSKPVSFAGALLNPLDRTLQYDSRTVLLTPREVTLVELLSRSIDEIVTYESLYHEILSRKFRGDTSNMRVLLAKLTTSVRETGLSLRAWIEVVPKTGYRYRSHPLMPNGDINQHALPVGGDVL